MVQHLVRVHSVILKVVLGVAVTAWCTLGTMATPAQVFPATSSTHRTSKITHSSTRRDPVTSTHDHLSTPQSGDVIPGSLLIYYGWLGPSASTMATQIQTLSSYNRVVLGAGLEDPTNPDYQATHTVIQHCPDTTFYGYISIGLTGGTPDYPISEVLQLASQWKTLGVHGIFLDDAGPDWGVTRTRLTTLIAGLRQMGLPVIVNAWQPVAVEHVGLTSQDGYLAENWAVADGHSSQPPSSAVALSQLEAQGISVYATATLSSAPSSPAQITTAVRETATIVPGVTGIAVAGQDYSSQSDAMIPASWIQWKTTSIPRIPDLPSHA